MKYQSIKNKKGEVDFRKKLADQFQGKTIIYPGEPTSYEYRTILKQRIKDYTRYFNMLEKQNIDMNPFLELGGGVGQGAMLLENKFGTHGFTSDISFETLKLAPRYLNEFDYSKMPIRICCDLYNLPFKSRSIPFIFTFQTLHHLPDPKPALEEINRVLSPGGYFYFNEEPVAQVINLNLWRRDRHLRWFEKILKTLIILHFISRIGKSEVDNNILEETFSLPIWEKALNIFPKAKVYLKIFPFGPTIKRTKTKKNRWTEIFILKRLMLNIMGGGIEAICEKNKTIQYQKERNIFDVLACPDCRFKPPLWFNKKTKTFLCKKCNRVFQNKRGVYLLFKKDQEKELYGPEINK